MVRCLLLFAAAVLVACSPPDPAQDEAAQAPTSLPPGREAVYDAARTSPEAFVRALYEAKGAGAMGEAPAPGQDPIYGRMLNAMIGEMHRRSGGSAPALQRDPLCDCRDAEDLRLQSVAVRSTSTTQAQADVVFTNAGETHQQTLELLKEGPMWRVADVRRPGVPPLSETFLAVIG